SKPTASRAGLVTPDATKISALLGSPVPLTLVRFRRKANSVDGTAAPGSDANGAAFLSQAHEFADLRTNQHGFCSAPAREGFGLSRTEKLRSNGR
ncbi:MAG: hypothetical protein WA400_19540, partial [Silvibacterium sp.]